jgi:hypothetical protein
MVFGKRNPNRNGSSLLSTRSLGDQASYAGREAVKAA